MARSALGRGLGALIPPTPAGVGTSSDLKMLAIGAIHPNRYQPRSTFDEEALDDLTASIAALGVLQPILVRPDGEGYELIAGERRWRAAKRAGLVEIPALVREVDDSTSLAQAVVENLQREDLNPLETAAAYQQLIEEFEFTHEQVAERVGKSRTAITNTLRLFQLPATVQALVADGTVSAGAARALLGTTDRAFQESIAKRIAAEGLSVREVETAVRERMAPDESLEESLDAVTETVRSGSTLRPPGVVELESLLSDHLDTRVSVDLSAKRGKVVIEFADVVDLERIYRRMTESV